jgi:hypothetical protein
MEGTKAPPKDEFRYNPKPLLALCLSQMGKDPTGTILNQENALCGLGEDLLTEVLLSIMAETNLTVPIVRCFEGVAKMEDHKRILKFIQSLDLFWAIGPAKK